MSDSSKPQHTPTPWVLDVTGPMHQMICETARHSISGIEMDSARSDSNASAYDRDRANAAFIVKAVNNFDALVEALAYCKGKLEQLIPLHTEDGAWLEAERVLAQARGREGRE